MRRKTPSICLVSLLICAAALGASSGEWLSLGSSKGWAATVYAKRGLGTADAVAEARVTREEIEGWCQNWSPADKGCVARELATPEAKRSYRASADCVAGRITTASGGTYTLAGTWDASDIGAGRTKWRDADGKIVGRDNASGGLGISQQWELLCPGPLKVRRSAAPFVPPAAAQPAAGAQFAVGEIVHARHGRDWVPGRVQAIRKLPGPRGVELQYDVRLDNGMRGILPARMLRKAPGG